MGDERVRLVEGIWRFWAGDLVTKLKDEEFVAGLRSAAPGIMGTNWEFIAEEGSQALGMTSPHTGIEGFLAIWHRWIEAFERWDARLDGVPIEVERERVLARVPVHARSRAGLEMELDTGVIYSFDGVELRLITTYREWTDALRVAGISEAEAEVLQRESARAKQID
jgi:hypothetical protein